MASRIQGITVEIGGDTTKLSKALEGVNKSIKGTQSGLKDVNKLLKLDPTNTELVVQKQKMLKDAIEATKETPVNEPESMEEFSQLATDVMQECRPTMPILTASIPEKTVRVAAYIRVSSTNPAQEDSYEMQERYFMSLLARSTGWTSAGIYSDHGISATSREKRTGFNRLLRHCKQGKIDRVICKSISRFARNTQDFLVALRTLKENGVTILFEREAMDTADAYSEFILTTLAAIAQEESRSISANIAWSNQKRFPAGNVCNKDIYGYEFRNERAYSKLLLCGECGRYFQGHSTTRTTIWRCATKVSQQGQKQCQMESVYEEQIQMMLRKAFAEKFKLGEKVDKEVHEVMQMISKAPLNNVGTQSLKALTEKLREIHDFDRMEQEGDFLKRQLSAVNYSIRDANQHIRDIQAEKDALKVRSAVLGEPMDEEAITELETRLFHEENQLEKLELEAQQQAEQVRYMETR